MSMPLRLVVIVGVILVMLAGSGETLAQCDAGCVFIGGTFPYPLPDECNELCRTCTQAVGQGGWCKCVAPDGWGCDTGDVCTSHETCLGGGCGGGDPTCPYFEECSTDYCHADCPFNCCRVNYPAGTPCDNGNFCDGPDVCNGAGTCLPAAGVGDNPCPSAFCDGSCNELQDQCNPPPHCHEDPDNKCTRDSCNPNGPYCVHEPLDCDDDDICNGDEWCDEDLGCQEGDPPDCNDHNRCTDDRCDPASGCEHTNNTRRCEDGNLCTTLDRCDDGLCEPGPPRVCNDNNICTTNYCDADTGCYYVPVNCSDGLPCTVDRCNAQGVCEHDCSALPTPEALIPTKDDRTFVYEDDQRLETTNEFCSAGICTFDEPNHRLEVTRYAGPTNEPNGNLTHAAALIADQLAGQYAVLTIYMQGVLPGTNHTVSFNGGPAVKLKASPSCGWSTTVIPNIDLAQVKFPESRGPLGSPPTPRANTLTITVQGNPTCLRFRGASLSVKLMSPIILVPGNGRDGLFFIRHGFTQGLDQKHLLWDNSLTSGRIPIAQSGNNLATLVPRIVTSFGVDSFHLVAHSKGGLDAREYLAVHYFRRTCSGGTAPGTLCIADTDCPGTDAECKGGNFKILSLTTLGTPHNGSVHADVSETRKQAASVADKIEFWGFPEMTDLLAYLDSAWAFFSPDGGRPDLTTTACARFNNRNMPTLRPFTNEIVYNVVGGDADSNFNHVIDLSHEYRGMWLEEAYLQWLPQSKAIPALNTLYQTLRSTSSVIVGYSSLPTSVYYEGIPVPAILPLATIVSQPTAVPQDNDILVTVDSAHGVGTFDQLVTEIWRLTDVDHCSLTDSGTALDITISPGAMGIVEIEKTRGDLR